MWSKSIVLSFIFRNAIILIPPYKNSNEVEKLMKSLKDSGFGVNLTSLGGEGVTINIEYTNK